MGNDKPTPDTIGSEAWAILATGLALTFVVFPLPFLNRIFSSLTTIIHELGHAVVGFLFGYPSLPALDFRYGGGITLHRHQSLLIVALVYAALAGAAYTLRRNRKGLSVAGAAIAGYALVTHTEAHRVIILFMGHGTELTIAAVFLFRALVVSHGTRYVERPLYAACGFYIVIKDLVFAWGLITSTAARARYGAAKGGGHWMDFSRIARHLDCSVEAVALVFLLFCLLTPVAALLLRRYRAPLGRWMLDLFAVDGAP